MASPNCFAALINTKDRGEIFQLDVGAAIIGLVGEPEGNRSRPNFTNARRVRVVGAVKNRPARLLEQLRKDLFDRREIGVKIEMLFLYI